MHKSILRGYLFMSKGVNVWQIKKRSAEKKIQAKTYAISYEKTVIGR